MTAQEFADLCLRQAAAELKYVRLADSRWVTAREILLAKQEADRLAEAVRSAILSN